MSVLVLVQGRFYPMQLLMESTGAQKKGTEAILLEILLHQQVAKSIMQLSGQYYAIACGLQPSVYNLWDKCAPQVVGIKGVVLKSFVTRE